MKKCSLITIWVFPVTAVILTLRTAAGIVTGPGWDIAGVGDFNGDGCRDSLRGNQATGEVVVWCMCGVVHSDHDAIAARAPPIDMVGVCDLNGDVSPCIIWRHIATLADSCPYLTVGFPCSTVVPDPCIRAPPIWFIHFDLQGAFWSRICGS